MGIYNNCYIQQRFNMSVADISNNVKSTNKGNRKQL